MYILTSVYPYSVSTCTLWRLPCYEICDFCVLGILFVFLECRPLYRLLDVALIVVLVMMTTVVVVVVAVVVVIAILWQ